MRLQRLNFTFIAFYLVFVGGSAYYNLIFPIKILHHIVVTLLLSLWLVWRIRSKRGLPTTPLNPPLYLAVAVWFLTAFLAIDPRMALENVWFLMTHLVMFFVLVDLFQRGRQRMVMETQFLLATLVVFISGMELASWYFGLGIVGPNVGWPDIGILTPPRLPSLSLAMNVSTLLAGYIAPLVIVTITWALTTTRKDYRNVLWILALLLLVTLTLTFSRGGLIAFAGGMGIFILIRLAQAPRITAMIPQRVILGAGIVGGIAGLLLMVLLVLPFGKGQSDEGRLDMWRSAAAITLDHPISGVGPGEYGRALRSYRTPELARDKLVSSHNAYLNTLSETGIPGLIAATWLGITLLRTIWQTHKDMKHWRRKLRVEGMFAALIVIAIHSMVDTFTTTPVVTILLVVAAYASVGHRSRLDSVPQGQRLPAIIALILVLGYGIWWIGIADRAQTYYMTSLSGGDQALQQAEQAHQIDPSLNLYTLQIAHLSGQQATGDTLDSAIAAYETALKREPTWDIGWMNLAALMERKGDLAQAFVYLEKARNINPMTAAQIHWARLAETLGKASNDDILAAYTAYLNNPFPKGLPLSDFWWETPLRREVIMHYIEKRGIIVQYRVLVEHNPEQAYALVPETPETSAEWWAAGEYALTVEDDPQTAAEYLSQAVELSPRSGDFYASRARAYAEFDVEAARADLIKAERLGTAYEYLNAVRVKLAEDEDEANRLKETAVPIRQNTYGQEFAAVLYGGRPAEFQLLPEVSEPGPGRLALAPWYELAYAAREDGHEDEAQRIFRIILNVAPFEQEAYQQLN